MQLSPNDAASVIEALKELRSIHDFNAKVGDRGMHESVLKKLRLDELIERIEQCQQAS